MQSSLQNSRDILYHRALTRTTMQRLDQQVVDLGHNKVQTVQWYFQCTANLYVQFKMLGNHPSECRKYWCS